VSKEQTCKNCWFIKHKGEAFLSNALKKYEVESCSLEGSPLPKELTCPDWMANEGTRGEDK
jgi:hypothetical protein